MPHFLIFPEMSMSKTGILNCPDIRFAYYTTLKQVHGNFGEMRPNTLQNTFRDIHSYDQKTWLVFIKLICIVSDEYCFHGYHYQKLFILTFATMRLHFILGFFIFNTRLKHFETLYRFENNKCTLGSHPFASSTWLHFYNTPCRSWLWKDA